MSASTPEYSSIETVDWADQIKTDASKFKKIENNFFKEEKIGKSFELKVCLIKL